jgi:hypothetical protein
MKNNQEYIVHAIGCSTMMMLAKKKKTYIVTNRKKWTEMRNNHAVPIEICKGTNVKDCIYNNGGQQKSKESLLISNEPDKSWKMDEPHNYSRIKISHTSLTSWLGFFFFHHHSIQLLILYTTYRQHYKLGTNQIEWWDKHQWSIRS